MRTRLALLVAVLQVAVLAFMAAEREWILRTGRTVFLRTAPIDPRDPMRGDYVRFDYEIARVPKELCRDGVPDWFKLTWPETQRVQDRVVYALLKAGEDGVAQLAALTDRRPATGEFVRGRAQSIDGFALRVRFGVEAMFTEQGRARELEVEQAKRPGLPLNIEAAVSDSGTAVLKGYRWEPLGIALTFDRVERPAVFVPGAPPRAVTGATVELKNYSDRPVAIVIQPDGGSFRLMPNDRVEVAPRVRWVGADAPLPKPGADMLKLLAPGGTYREHLDFTTPAWFVREIGAAAPNTPMAWGALANPWSISFRLEYVPPTRADSAGLPHAELIRHSRLRSRAFNPVGAVD
ncbi:MAG TPA: GDYXXLXY domain-containing protein [Opitutaceae bacterium]|nr:GDYXXLXY domain-containing protein [Opitutaceae bacterium]